MERYNALLTEIAKLPVIDTHEHLSWDETSAGWNASGDILGEYLTHYMSSDVVSAGLSQEDLQRVRDGSRDITDRWRIVEPYWEAARYTGYGRALDRAVKTIYGFDGVRRETIVPLNQAFLNRSVPGHYRHVLKDLCNIRVSLLDDWTFHREGVNEFFRRVWQPMDYILPSEPNGKDILAFTEREHGITVRSLDDWMAACEAELDWQLSTNGVRILKCAIAYHRTLRFEKTPHPLARQQFADALGKRRDGACMSFPRELQDFMMHHILGLANARNLTFQFHTGLLEGNGNTLSHSDPSLMNNLFLEYPGVDFDLFHISYPYHGVACALAKMFPNVYLDMCWAHIISPHASVAALGDFLDAVPYNKISAFGGDYLFPDGVCGHLEISRENVARTLARKVEEGVFSEDRALVIAKALYYGNPRRIFKLGDLPEEG